MADYFSYNISVNSDEGILDSTATPSGYYEKDTEITASVTAKYGYKFKEYLLRGYSELEYIESTGTQYINTGINDNLKDLTAEMEIAVMANGSTLIYGSQWSGNSNILHTGSNSFWYYYGSNSYTNPPYILNEWTSIKLNKQQIVVNGTSYSVGGTPTAFGTVMFLGISGYMSHARARKFKMYKNNELILDFIPVIRHSDMKVGMLDLVHMKFYGNSGTGEFIPGPTKVEHTIKDIEELEYIESTGIQYIDTEIPFQNNLNIDIKYRYLNNANDKDVLGCDNDGSSKWSILLNYYSNKNRLVVNNASQYNSSQTLSVGTDYIANINNNGSTTIIQNEEIWNSAPNTNYTSIKSLTLFARNSGSGVGQYSCSRVYYCQMSLNDVLVRDFIPARSKITGRLGLFDKVNNKFYINQGTGEFLPGKVV